MRSISLILILFAVAYPTLAQSAHQRAARMGLGMNFSYLENWWLGKKEKGYSDFTSADAAKKKEVEFAKIAKAGFKTVRIPINFGVWASYEKPYGWTSLEGLEIADRFVKAALDAGLIAIVDLHHVEMDRSVKAADSTERMVWMWKELALRYRDLDPERVLFEIRNEPHDIEARAWRRQAEAVIKAIREIAPKHTLVVGFHDWNSRQAMIDSKPFEDDNIIYTFHYYDPFIFTHQGATWSSPGLSDLKQIPFPADGKAIAVPDKAKGTWVADRIAAYREDSRSEKMFEDLKTAKAWADKHKAPIFLGEFGSFGKNTIVADRCRHAEAVYSALGKLGIPNAWWEWDQGFNMYDEGTTSIAPCMQKAIDLFIKGRSTN
jgi:endoglucanase